MKFIFGGSSKSLVVIETIISTVITGLLLLLFLLLFAVSVHLYSPCLPYLFIFALLGFACWKKHRVKT